MRVVRSFIISGLAVTALMAGGLTTASAETGNTETAIEEKLPELDSAFAPPVLVTTVGHRRASRWGGYLSPKVRRRGRAHRRYHRHHRRYRHHRHHRHHRYRHHRHHGWGGVISGIIIGGILVSEYRYNQHVNWCYRRYRSYHEPTNSFKPHRGRRRACHSPYWP